MCTVLTRAEMLADLILHGFEPMSALSQPKTTFAVGRPTKETIIGHRTTFEVLKVNGHMGQWRQSDLRVTERRGKREWGQVTTPRLRLMYEALQRRRSKVAEQAKANELNAGELI